MGARITFASRLQGQPDLSIANYRREAIRFAGGNDLGCDHRVFDIVHKSVK